MHLLKMFAWQKYLIVSSIVRISCRILLNKDEYTTHKYFKQFVF